MIQVDQLRSAARKHKRAGFLLANKAGVTEDPNVYEELMRRSQLRLSASVSLCNTADALDDLYADLKEDECPDSR